MAVNNNDNVTFPNLLNVTNYLNEKGWRIKKSAVYLHFHKGKIRPREDGFFYIKDVEKYAKTFLKRIETGQKMNVTLEKMQEKRLAAEIKKLEAQEKYLAIKVKAAEGFFIERDAFERELAQRAARFKNDIELFIRSEAEKIIGLAEGKAAKVPDVIEYMLDQLADWPNRYADEGDFVVPVPVPATQPSLDIVAQAFHRCAGGISRDNQFIHSPSHDEAVEENNDKEDNS